MTRDEVVSKVLLPKHRTVDCCCESCLTWNVDREQLLQSIPALLWIARSEEEIYEFLKTQSGEKEQLFGNRKRLAHSLFEWLRGDE